HPSRAEIMLPDHRSLALAVGLVVALTGCSRNTPQPDPTPANGKVIKLSPGPKVQDEVQTALIKAQPGDTLEFSEGTFEFTGDLTLSTQGVTLRGQGKERTTLSFKGQEAGKYGLHVSRGGFVLQDLTVEDTKGDAVKVEGGDGVVFRRVRARWSGEPRASNGAQGL